MLFTVEDERFRGLRVPVLNEHLLNGILDFLNGGHAVLAIAVLKVSYHLVADAFGLFTVFSAHGFDGFPNSVSYSFLIEWFKFAITF
jgi:hypothetical protein